MYVERELGTLGDDLAGWIVLVLPSLENVDFGLWCWRGRNIPVWGLGARGDSETSCKHGVNETSTTVARQSLWASVHVVLRWTLKKV